MVRLQRVSFTLETDTFHFELGKLHNHCFNRPITTTNFEKALSLDKVATEEEVRTVAQIVTYLH